MANKSNIDITATNKTDRAFKSVDKNLKGMSQEAKAAAQALAGISAVGVAAIGGLAVLTKRSLDSADALSKAAQVAGLTSSAFQEYAYAADLAGISQESFSSGLAAFNKRLGELKSGTGALTTFLKKYDQGLADAIKSTGSTEKAFDLLIERLADIKDPADQAALASAAFGRSVGTKMIPLLKDGSAGLDQMKQEARDLGLILGDDLLKGAEAANDAMTKVNKVIDAQIDKVLLELAPAIEGLADATAKELANVDLDGFAEGFVDAFEVVALAGAGLIDFFANLATAFNAVKAVILTGYTALVQGAELVATGLNKVGLVGDESLRAISNASAALNAQLSETAAKVESGLLRTTAFETVSGIFDEARSKIGETGVAADNLGGSLAELTDKAGGAGKSVGKLGEETKKSAESFDDVLGSTEGLEKATEALNKQYEQQLEVERKLQAQKDALAQASRDYIAALDEEVRLLKVEVELGADEADIQREIAAAKADGLDVSEDQIRVRLEDIQATYEQIEAQEQFKDTIGEISGVLTGVLLEGESFTDGMVDLFEDMLKRMAALAIAETIAGFFGLGSGVGGSANYGAILGQVIGTSGTTSAASAGGSTIFGGASTASGGGAVAVSGGTATGGGSAAVAGTGASTTSGAGAAGSGSAGAGASLGYAAVAAAVLYGLYEWTNSNEAKRQEKAIRDFTEGQFEDQAFGSTNFRTRTDGALAGRQGFVSGGFNAANIADAAGSSIGIGGTGVTDSEGNYYFQIRDGIEAAQEALAGFSPEVQAFQQAQFEAAEKELANHSRRKDAEAELITLRKQQAVDTVNSQKLVEVAFEETTNAIIESYGSVDTTVAGVAEAIKDGLITSAEAAANGLAAGAVGMVGSLAGVLNQANLAAIAVARVGEAGRAISSGIGDLGGRSGGGQGVSATASASSIQRGIGDGRGGRATGGISRGPTSGYAELLHGNEAVVPLGNGDVARFPVQIKGGSEELLMAFERMDKRLLAIESNTRETVTETRSGSDRVAERIDRNNEVKITRRAA